MRILIVNDDGIYAKGIVELANGLKNEHEVTVIAPDSECSGWSHYLHFHIPVSYEKIDDIDGCECYRLAGTPCDCPKFGIFEIMKENLPDVVLSGINNGVNAATDVIYSGTVNAAIEAAINGVKAIAISVGGHENEYGNVVNFIANNLHKLLDITEYVTSINFPTNDITKIKGIRFTEVGINKFNDEYIQLPNSGKYGNSFMLTGEEVKDSSGDIDKDISAIHEGYVSITPIKPQFTDFERLAIIKNCVLKL